MKKESLALNVGCVLYLCYQNKIGDKMTKEEIFKAIDEEYDTDIEKIEALLDEGFELEEILEMALDY